MYWSVPYEVHQTQGAKGIEEKNVGPLCCYFANKHSYDNRPSLFGYNTDGGSGQVNKALTNTLSADV